MNKKLLWIVLENEKFLAAFEVKPSIKELMKIKQIANEEEATKVLAGESDKASLRKAGFDGSLVN